MSNNTTYVLWTGGWDSTFCLIRASRLYDATIQPIYVSGDGRNSEAIEIETMNSLLPQIRKASGLIINDLMVIDKSKIPEDKEITDAFVHIRDKVRIGTQYEWLARLAKMYPGIEIGIEKPNGEYSGCVTAIEQTGKLVKKNTAFYIDPEESSEDCCLLFGNFSFPIVDIDEQQMIPLIREWGCDNIMKGIWFCHNPIDKQPCGYCRPCQQKMECGMEWLLPKQAQKRYQRFKRIEKICGLRAAKKVMRLKVLRFK